MTKLRRVFTTLLAIIFISTATIYAVGQDAKAALQRGYRTGYSDGYMAGYRDSIDNATSDFRRHNEYTEAKRAYNKDYGSIEDYGDGYRQGFENGYSTGFEKRSFESSVPSNLTKSGNGAIASTQSQKEPQAPAVELETQPVLPQTGVDLAPTQLSTQPEMQSEAVSPAPVRNQETAAAEQASQPMIQRVSYTRSSDDPIIIIPRDTELIIEIQEPLSTETNRVGDKFIAKIMSPYEITGATIEGRIERITKPGRIKRRAEMLLTFDRVVLSDERWSNFSAIVTEVLPVKGDNVKSVDNEGTAIGRRSIKEDAIKVGATTGAGLGIGALTAGPVGAAVGAGVGAAFGVGAVVIERGKHIQLNQNQQLRIRTAYETKIR